MRKIFLFWLCFLHIQCFGQRPKDSARCNNPQFDKTVARYLSFSVRTISPVQLSGMSNVLVLDARERKEFEVSHLPNAQYCGFDNFEAQILRGVAKDTPIVVYCSIGYRSEKIGEKLQKMGFTNVFNLYGSIFEWVNQGYGVVDKNGNPTQKVHTYNKDWSKWIEKGKAEKVW